MKLIFCPRCQDVFKLQTEMRFCKCKTVFGRYRNDGLNAIVSRHALVLGFDNGSLARALEKKTGVPLNENELLKHREKKLCDEIIDFKAFIIPDSALTVEQAKDRNSSQPENIDRY